MKSIGIMGGTFNPIHIGHLIAAEEVRVRMKLDEILFIPTGNPPHKSERIIVSSHHRYEMVRLAIENNNYFKASDMEIRRLGKTYTYDTLKELGEAYNDVRINFIIGFDTLKEIDTWKRINEVCSLCSFIVVNRNNNYEEMLREMELRKNRYNADISIVDIPNIEISSTDIRDRISGNKSIKYLVPYEVEKYIHENQLFRGAV